MLVRYLRLLIVPFAVSLLLPPTAVASPARPIAPDDCDVTLPNSETPPDEESNRLDWYGSGDPDASLWLMMTWTDGVFQSEPEVTYGATDDTVAYPLKLTFWRSEGSGDVTVSATDDEGTQLSPGAFEPFRGTPIPGLHPLGGAVPEPGCWTFTSTDGNDTITWTMLITSPYGDCDVTLPNGLAPADAPEIDTGDWQGSDSDRPSLWLMNLSEQIITPSPFFEPRDEGGYSMKTPFWRGEGSGQITLSGERLDEESAYTPHIDAAWDSYEIPGFIATGIWYPTEGCWELTATDGNDTLTWTVLVQSPFANCLVTSGADDDGTVPENVILGSGMSEANPDDYYGVNGLYVTLGDSDTPVRAYPIDSGLVSETGAISDKFVWYRQGDAEGTLVIDVEIPDLWFPTEPVIVVPDGYGTSGVQASGITFPGEGCWEVTGTSGDVSIAFYLRLEIVPAE